MNIFIAIVNGQEAELTPEESWHCAKVLRKKTGENVHLIDGKGNYYEGSLDFVSERSCRVKITKGPRPQHEWGYYLHLAIAPTKQIDRVEWMLEKAVEIGVNEFSFVVCHNSERKVIKTERIQKIIESAVKQSLQARLPTVNELCPLQDLLQNSGEEQKLIAHCFASPKKEIRKVEFRNKRTLVLVGPEGDFSKEEVALALNSGFEALDLGHNRLRSETAALFVCQAASILAG